jgi:hypothetical protein
MQDGGVAFVLSAQQLRICRAVLEADAEAVPTSDLYATDTPTASDRASLSRSVRRLEALNVATRPKRGRVALTEEGRSFISWALERDLHKPQPLPSRC